MLPIPYPPHIRVVRILAESSVDLDFRDLNGGGDVAFDRKSGDGKQEVAAFVAFPSADDGHRS